MTSCLVVGGGLLGGATAAALRDAGHEVTVFSRSVGPGLQTEQDGIRLVTGTISASGELPALIETADAVFYFAGGSTPVAAATNAAGSLELSVVPATTVLDLMRRTSTRRIVLSSSGGTVYGEAQRFPTPEDHPTRPIGIHGHHALTVERYAEFYAEHEGLEPVTLRIATAYGPGQRTRRGQGVISAWTHAALVGDPLQVYGSLGTRRDFVYAADVAQAAMRGALEAPPGIYNVGSGASNPLSDVVEGLAELAGRELEVVENEPRGVDVSRTELDCSRLEAAIGWRPQTQLAEGLRRTWDWFVEQPGYAGSSRSR